MKSHREVLIRPIALSVAAILLTSLVVTEAYSYAKALHVRDPEDLALAYLLPTIFIAVLTPQGASPNPVIDVHASFLYLEPRSL